MNKDISNKIYYYLFAALAFCIPIYDRFVVLVILLIALNWIFEFNFKTKFNRVKNSRNSKYILGFSSIYIFYLIGTLYSHQLSGQSGAFFDLEVKLSLLIFPLFFATIDFSSIQKNFFSNVRYTYILGCIITSLILLNNAVFQYFIKHDSSVFYYTSLSMWHHAGYLGLYFNVAIAFLITWLIPNWKNNAQKRFAAIILVLFFQVLIVLLSSKAAILGMVLMFVLIIVFYIVFERKQSRLPVILSVSLMISFFITLALFPHSYKRFNSATEAISERNQVHSQLIDGSVARMLVWKCSLEIIAENPIFGVGTGDVKTELMKKYEEKNIERAIREKFNSHDQFLQTFIALGLVGFIVLLATLILPMIAAIRRKKLLYILFIAVFTLHMLVESMLERQGGVVFYAFFNAFLFYYSMQEEKNDESEIVKKEI